MRFSVWILLTGHIWKMYFYTKLSPMNFEDKALTWLSILILILDLTNQFVCYNKKISTSLYLYSLLKTLIRQPFEFVSIWTLS